MRLRSIVYPLLVLVLGLLFSGCSDRPATTEPVASTEVTSPPSPATTEPSVPETTATTPEVLPDREVIALINGSPAYRDEFEDARDALLKQYEQTYAQFGMDISMLLAGADGRMFELGIDAEAVLQIFQMILTRQEAEQQGIVISDETVQQEIDLQYGEYLADQGWTEADLALSLAQQGRTVESFKEDVKEYVYNQMLAMEVQKAVAGPLDITDEQLSEYFVTNHANYSKEERVRASHILVDTREQAEEIQAELDAGADFATLASERSTCPSGPSGGDLDWFGLGAMVAPFEEAAYALSIGEVSDIVETEFGYHIILLTDRQDAASPELDEVIDQVQADLEGELSYEAAVAWYGEAYGSAEIVIYDPLLGAIIKQRDDVNAAIAMLEQVQSDGTSDDPYLPYVLGSFYERKMTDAPGELATAEIEELRAKALAAYQLAQEANASDTSIQAKITEIEALSGGSEEETP